MINTFKILILVTLALSSSPCLAQMSEAIEWRYGRVEHLRTQDDAVVEWPVRACGHRGHLQRGLGARPTDKELEALRLEYLASQERADKLAEVQEREEDGKDLPSHEDAVRDLEALTEVLIEEGLIRADRIPARAMSRINRRRIRQGREPL